MCTRNWSCKYRSHRGVVESLPHPGTPRSRSHLRPLVVLVSDRRSDTPSPRVSLPLLVSYHASREERPAEVPVRQWGPDTPYTPLPRFLLQSLYLLVQGSRGWGRRGDGWGPVGHRVRWGASRTRSKSKSFHRNQEHAPSLQLTLFSLTHFSLGFRNGPTGRR